MDSFATIINGCKPLRIVAKLFILDICGGVDCARTPQTFKMVSFATIINDCKPLTVVARLVILEVALAISPLLVTELCTNGLI